MFFSSLCMIMSNQMYISVHKPQSKENIISSSLLFYDDTCVIETKFTPVRKFSNTHKLIDIYLAVKNIWFLKFI